MALKYSELIKEVQKVYSTGRTTKVSWRLEQIRGIVRLIDEEEERLCEALYQDLHKCRAESLGFEIRITKSSCIDVLNNLESWVQPTKAARTLAMITDGAHIRSQPLGTVLIMGAWNYPFHLTLEPLVGAIAAGNCVILKPSEVAENMAKLLEELIPKYLDPECIKVINGGIPETTALLRERFDKIFYTGSSGVGKIVMEAAAKHLTPVALELGGKSPVYVDPSSDIYIAARRIVWGKFANAGQTCVAPDYVLCHSSIQESLVAELQKTITEFYGEDPQQSPDYGRLINDRHFGRVKALVERSKGTVVHGAKFDAADKYIMPTVVTNVQATDSIMQEEIFGPVLPIITVEGVQDAIQFINSREKPLALYVFSKDKKVIEQVIECTSSGGVCVNDTVMHLALASLPFGGVGNSGMGAYHGKHSFDCFSHQRSVLTKAQKMESVNTLRYPPFSEKKSSWLLWAMSKSENKGVTGYVRSWFS